MIDNKNIVLAVVLSIIILVGFDMFFAKDRPAPPPGDQPRRFQSPGGAWRRHSQRPGGAVGGRIKIGPQGDP